MPFLLGSFASSLIVLLVSVAVSQAVYYIDDCDTSITYNGTNSDGGVKEWAHVTSSYPPNLPTAGCFKGSFSWAYCLSVHHCRVDIPFLGCGITVYVAQHSDDWTFNASVTLDSYFQTLASLPSPSVASTYNISIYDVQSLSIARHNLSLTLLSFYNSSGTEYPSSIYFDYAAISEQCLSPSRKKTGPIVGGVVGGLAIISGAILVFLCFRRGRPAPREYNKYPAPKPARNRLPDSTPRNSSRTSSIAYTGPPLTALEIPRSQVPAPADTDSTAAWQPRHELEQTIRVTHSNVSLPTHTTILTPVPSSPQSPPGAIPSNPPNAAFEVPRAQAPAPTDRVGVTMWPHQGQSTEVAHSDISLPSQRTALTAVPGSPRPPPSAIPFSRPREAQPLSSFSPKGITTTSTAAHNPVPYNRLSDHQVDFVNELYNLNVPAPTVASVIGRMMRGGDITAGRQASDAVAKSASYSEFPI